MMGAYANQNKPKEPVLKIPIHEINARHPLGSHLPFPMNVNAPETSPRNEWPRPSLEPAPDSPNKGPRRRATLPSLILSQGDTAALTAMWDKETKENGVLKQTPTPDIGLAITSASGHNSRRRSRSADALNDMAREQDLIQAHSGEAKRASRAEEIAYWRASQLGTATRDFAPIHERLFERPDKGDSSSEASMKTANAIPQETSHGHLHTADDEDDDDDDEDSIQRRTPPNERQSFEQPSPENVRMSHPFIDRAIAPQIMNHVAPPANHSAPTLANSVDQVYSHHTRNFSRPVMEAPERNHLEERLDRLETWMQKVETSRNVPSVMLNSAPKTRASREPSNEEVGSKRKSVLNTDFGMGERESSVMQPRDERSMVDISPSTAHGSSPKTPTLPTHHANSSFNHNQPMPSSGLDSTQSFSNFSATKLPSQEFSPLHQQSYPYGQQYSQQNPESYRPATAHNFAHGQPPNHVASSLPSPNIYDHLAPLYAALRYERSKRKEFEIQMRQMRQELYDLSCYMRGYPPDRNWDGGAKPTNSFPQNHGNRMMPYPTPSPEDAFGGSAASFSSSTDFERERMRRRYNEQQQRQEQHQSRFSGDYDSSDNEGDNTRGGAEKETFRTPKEESTFNLSSQPPSQSLSENTSSPTDSDSKMSRSKLPTPKQSMKNMRSANNVAAQQAPSVPSAPTISAKASIGSIGTKNRFGFPGGKS